MTRPVEGENRTLSTCLVGVTAAPAYLGSHTGLSLREFLATPSPQT